MIAERKCCTTKVLKKLVRIETETLASSLGRSTTARTSCSREKGNFQPGKTLENKSEVRLWRPYWAGVWQRGPLSSRKNGHLKQAKNIFDKECAPNRGDVLLGPERDSKLDLSRARR
jgi:hypothetical protein